MNDNPGDQVGWCLMWYLPRLMLMMLRLHSTVGMLALVGALVVDGKSCAAMWVMIAAADAPCLDLPRLMLMMLSEGGICRTAGA